MTSVIGHLVACFITLLAGKCQCLLKVQEINETLLFLRNCRRQRQDDVGYDLDHHLAFRYPRHFRGGDDRQGGPVALVPAQNCTLQERQRPKLSSQVRKLIFPPRRCMTSQRLLFIAGGTAWPFAPSSTATDPTCWTTPSCPRTIPSRTWTWPLTSPRSTWISPKCWTPKVKSKNTSSP